MEVTESLSDSTSVLRKATNLDVSPEFNTYSKVVIYVGKDDEGNDVTYEAGDDTGRVLEVTNPWGTQVMANQLLANLQTNGFQYQPYNATDAQVDPSAELGDGVSVNDVYSGLYVQDTTFSSLMSSDIAAPTDEEIDHEFPYESETERTFKRESAYSRAQISINRDSIEAEVSRASNAEGSLSSRITINANAITSEVSARSNADSALSSRITQTANSLTSEISDRSNADSVLSSRITQTANSLTSEINDRSNADSALSSRITQNANGISAEVTARTNADANKLDHTRTNSTFGWQLTATSFKINSSGSKNVFTADSNGIKIQGNAEVTGKVTATSGYIGNSSSGFTIAATKLYNGKSSISDENNGVYIGTDGIALGANSVFKVTKAGAVTAKNITVSGGSININDTFKVSSTGALTANMTSGSISLGSNFAVTSAGAITAKSGTIGGFTITASSLYNGKSSLNAEANGVYIGTNGISLGNGAADTNHQFRVTNAGAMTVKYGKSSLSDANSGVYIGTDGIALGAGNFKVTTSGALTSKSGNIGGFTIGTSAIYNGMTSYSDTDHNGVYVGTSGIALGKGNFKVSSSGALYAKSGTFEGAINAGSIRYGDSYGTFNGSGISGGSIGSGKLGGKSVSYSNLGDTIKKWLKDKEGIDLEKTVEKANETWSWIDSVDDGNGRISCNSINCGYLAVGSRQYYPETVNFCTGVNVTYDYFQGVRYVKSVSNNYDSERFVLAR